MAGQARTFRKHRITPGDGGGWLPLLLLIPLLTGILLSRVVAPAQATTTQTDHLYIYNGMGADDVTDTLYYVGSQTYVVHGGPIHVYLNYQDGYIYDIYYSVIGYIAAEVPPSSGSLP